MRQILNFKKNYFNYFLFIYIICGIFFSLNVGITHDESHELLVWNLNKLKIFNNLFSTNYDVSFLESGGKYYGFGFHLLSFPVELIVKFFLNNFNISENTQILLSKHPSVFIFFLISGIFLKKIIFLITKNKNYSFLCTILYLTYPYLLGHSFFNLKDIPFLSVWLICTYYIVRLLEYFQKEKKIKNKYIVLLSILTPYLLSIRISGILIFLEYLIFLIFFINIFNYKTKEVFKSFYKHTFLFFFIFLILFYILHPNYWNNPLLVIDSIRYMSQHIQTVCTITLGTCMKAQNLPSSYLPIWLFFKIPILIILGLISFPFVEKRIFSNKKNTMIIGSLLTTILTIIFLLIFFNTNLYDEIRQVMFLVPLIFIISLSSMYFFSKRLSFPLILFFVFFFIFQNIKIYPYNYTWLNNLTTLTKISGVFELDYWGVSSKNVARFFNKMNLDQETCIISNRNNGIEAFTKDSNICFLPFNNLHANNKRPFYVVLMERSTNKGLPNNCNNIHNEKININLSKENLIMAKIFKCD